MIASIKRLDNGYLAKYERPLNHGVDAVWAMLTDNTQLARWFEELQVGDLRQGGFIKFNAPGVIDENLMISELVPFSVLEFDWFGDVVRFELHPDGENYVLILKEQLNSLSEQTKMDLAGWHVCLDVIHALLNGQIIDRDEEWKIWYAQYTREIDALIALN